MKLRTLVLTAALLSSCALGSNRQFANGELVTLQPDQGYVLVRTFQRPGGALRGTVKFMPLLIRLLSSQELEQVKTLATGDPEHWMEKTEPNVAEPSADRPYAKEGDEIFLVTSLKPGTYVLGGLAVTNWIAASTGAMVTSLSMGTVKFEVKPGVLTDLGTVLNAQDDRPTAIPELAKVVSGKDLGFGFGPEDVALRPATPDTEIPAQLRGVAIVPADYHAVPPYPDYTGAVLGRLAPVAGILDYDKDGQVIDLKALAK